MIILNFNKVLHFLNNTAALVERQRLKVFHGGAKCV